jgi:ABC-type molybdate transport system substrate-binding protein
MHRVFAGCVSIVGLLVLSSLACAQELVIDWEQVRVFVFVDDAVTGIARQAGEVVERNSDYSLVVVGATAGSLQQRLESEPADVIFMAAPAIDALEKASRFVPGTRVDVARALIGDGQPPTIYSAAMMVTAENSEGARAFLRTLAGAEGRAAVTTAGLEPIGPAR